MKKWQKGIIAAILIIAILACLPMTVASFNRRANSQYMTKDQKFAGVCAVLERLYKTKGDSDGIVSITSDTGTLYLQFIPFASSETTGHIRAYIALDRGQLVGKNYYFNTKIMEIYRIFDTDTCPISVEYYSTTEPSISILQSSTGIFTRHYTGSNPFLTGDRAKMFKILEEVAMGNTSDPKPIEANPQQMKLAAVHDYLDSVYDMPTDENGITSVNTGKGTLYFHFVDERGTEGYRRVYVSFKKQLLIDNNYRDSHVVKLYYLYGVSSARIGIRYFTEIEFVDSNRSSVGFFSRDYTGTNPFIVDPWRGIISTIERAALET